MGLLRTKKEPTAREFRAYLQEQLDLADGNRQRMLIAGNSALTGRYSHTARWLEAAISEVDVFLNQHN